MDYSRARNIFIFFSVFLAIWGCSYTSVLADNQSEVIEDNMVVASDESVQSAGADMMEQEATLPESVETLDTNSINESIRDRQKKIELALQLEFLKYNSEARWPVNYPYSVADKVEKSGTLPGAYGSYTYRPFASLHNFSDLWSNPVPNFFRIEADGSFGKIDYETFAAGKRKFNAWDIDGRILAGYDFINNNDSRVITPYLGLGYRRYTDDAGGWVDYFVLNYADYTVKSSYYYIPIGVEVLQQINEAWDLTFKVEGDILVGGGTQFYLSEIPGTFDGHDVDTGEPLTLDPRNADSVYKGGFGLRSSVKLVKKQDRVNFFAEPYFKLWYIRKSKPQQAHSLATNNGKDYVSVYDDGSPYKPLFDPKNVTLTFGVRAGIQF